MIHGMSVPNNKTKMEDVVRVLNECLILNFYLTGSRLTKTENDKSDYDFFTSNNSEVEPFLQRNGFVKMPLNGRGGVKLAEDCPYVDSSIDCVYRAKCDDGHVDVQLIKRDFFPKKCEVNNFFARMCGNRQFAKFWSDLNKYSRRDIWQQMMFTN